MSGRRPRKRLSVAEQQLALLNGRPVGRAMTGAPADRFALYQLAREVQALAQEACDLAMTGPAMDLSRARELLGRAAMLARAGLAE